MNTFTNSTMMVDYAKVHSAELIRQAHLANGGSYLSQRSFTFSSCRFVRVASIKNVIRKYIGSFGLRDRIVKPEAKSTLQIGTSNG